MMQRAGDLGQPGAESEDLDTNPAAAVCMPDPEEGLGLPTHRAGDVEQEDDASIPAPAALVMDRSGFAEAPQALAQGAAGIYVAAARGGAAVRPEQWWSGSK